MIRNVLGLDLPHIPIHSRLLIQLEILSLSLLLLLVILEDLADALFPGLDSPHDCLDFGLASYLIHDFTMENLVHVVER